MDNNTSITSDSQLSNNALSQSPECIKTPEASGQKPGAPKEAPKPAPPIVEILDQVPEVMSRPLQIINGRAYAATWLPVKVTITEKVEKKGNITRLDPPQETTEIQLYIIRDDGVSFSKNGDKSLESLGFTIHLPEKPSPEHKLWSPTGVKAFLQGNRPVPIVVFRRIVDIVDQFIDFDHSLADQQTMAEFIACYILATWFLDAFNVIGFLWPNGERGSGKTNLLNVVAELGYLGLVVTAGGSFATLRDLADYGATIAFDDAENLSDPKASDPDKRALLLAGNRRGATVPLKEPDGNRGWKTRHVNTFCPRLFSAIRVPDPVLASRSIIVPLTRTSDRQRGNTDPADFERWKHDRRTSIDDLWALAVSRLPDLKAWDDWVGKNAHLTGRSLQPWRAILAIAAWLESCGEAGLWQQMDQLSVDYQQERHSIELSDFTLLVIRAIIDCAICAISANSAIDREKIRFVFSASEIVERAIKIAHYEEWDIDETHITSRSVGRVLSKLRLAEEPRPGGLGSRKRGISLRELNRLAMSYNLELPDNLALVEETNPNDPSLSPNGTNGTNGSNGTGLSTNVQPKQLALPPLFQETARLTHSPTDVDNSLASETENIGNNLNGDEDEILLSNTVSLEKIAHGPHYPDTSRPCVSCREMAWRERPESLGGGWYCGSCHS